MIYIDMDGVISNFTKAALIANGYPEDYEYTSNEYQMERELGISTPTFWKNIDKGGVEFWENMEPYKWTEFLLGYFDKYIILTAPSLNPNCVKGKVEWMHKNIKKNFYSFIIAPARYKSLLAKSGDILIDDSDKNTEAWEKAGGIGILFPQPWNKNYKMADDPIGYTVGKLGSI